MTGLPDIVIGSGPSGVAAAAARLARGRAVLMLDVGKVLDPRIEASRVELSSRETEAWTDADRQAWQAGQFAAPQGQARRFGSDFAMEPTETVFASEPKGFGLRASHALGGLSNLWGAAVLPYAPTDIADWPAAARQLDGHYRAVAAFLPMSGVAGLGALFPGDWSGSSVTVEPSRQAERLLERTDRHKGRLAQAGIRTGASVTAVSPGCRLCGMCLHGCPWRLIWSAAETVASLRGNPHFTYSPGAPVDHVAERDGAVIVSRSGEVIRGARVFIGAGVLPTARLLLRSGLAGEGLVLSDSQQAFLPMLEPRLRVTSPARERRRTLAQVFVEIDRPDVSPNLVHAQVYTWNEFYAHDLMSTYGRRLPVVRPVLEALARRLVVAQIFLHSRHTAQVRLRLAPDGRLDAEVLPNAETGRTMDRAARALSSAMRRGGLLPLRPALRLGAAGSSFHAGSSLPMADRPGSGQSDVLGRPFGASLIHVVDATVLPTIPATTITFSVMATAHRIASEAPAD